MRSGDFLSGNRFHPYPVPIPDTDGKSVGQIPEPSKRKAIPLTERRTFLKTAAAIGGSLWLRPSGLLSSSRAADGFGVHPFIEANPGAVFIMRTTVDSKLNSEAKLEAGLSFGESVFVPMAQSAGGFPLTGRIAVKPNITSPRKSLASYTPERSMGVVTDPFFVEGVIEAVKDLGIPGNRFYLREVNTPEDFGGSGYLDVAARTGADIRDLSAEAADLDAADVVWKDVPEGVWFNRIPYLWPVNAPDTFLLNLAKFKAHSMGLTLCAKNLQGAVAHSYQAHCSAYNASMSIPAADVRPGARTLILSNYNRRVADGVPRWDRPGGDYTGGLGMETWASRCLDNNSVTRPGLHVIEGIYGHDGNFTDGPNAGGLAADFMSNLIVFGKNAFHVDVIGHWLGGHEPGNFGLFHMALERGLSSVLNPADIAVYEWKADGSAVRTPLGGFERTPLKTLYLRRDYNGRTEDLYHLCDEPYDYPTVGIRTGEGAGTPDVFVLERNYPNPFNPSTSIAFRLPRSGSVRVEILNGRGEIVDVPADGRFERGGHQVVWRAGGFPSGVYVVRVRFDSFVQTAKMTLVR
jgi:uncharacterized protein (DUF362 family)